MNQGNYALEVLVNGRPVREFFKDGKTFIEGRKDTQYSLRIRNNSWRRALAVVAIDGLDILTGKPASENGGGYIIEAWSNVEIKGFRESDFAVGSFKFTEKYNSYAASKGLAMNVGVIGVRVFSEKIPAPLPQVTNWQFNVSNEGFPIQFSGYSFQTGSMVPDNDISYTCSLNNLSIDPSKGGLCAPQMRSADAGGQAKGFVPNFSLGTTWGTRVTDRVTHVSFERDVMVGALDIYYGSRNDLVSMGINFVEETPVAFPSAFPTQYAKPPTNWRG